MKTIIYKGISKKDYPKWEGWKLIASYKKRNIIAEDIKDEKLDTLVSNFHSLIKLVNLVNSKN